jgi:hypothetical protein
VQFRPVSPKLLVSSIKGVKKKNTSPVAGFLLDVQPTPLSRIVLAFRSVDSERYQHSSVAVWVFSTSGFHHLFATKPVSSETNKAERWPNMATIVLFGTRGP